MDNTPFIERRLDALELLERDHASVQELFKDYEQSGLELPAKELVDEVCLELEIHVKLEDEVFYPNVGREFQDDELMREAMEEAHNAVRQLVEDLKALEPADGAYRAKFKVLGEIVNQHIKVEEAQLFTKAKKNGLDLMALGDRLRKYKRQLLAELTSQRKTSASVERGVN